MTGLKLDQWKSRWSFARGATKATQTTNGKAMTELSEALAEVDGLLAGINYLEKVEPEPEELPSVSASSEDADNTVPSNPVNDPWFGHLTIELPQLDPCSSEEQSKFEAKHLRDYLNSKLINSNDDPRQKPRKSQWATLRSLRKASMYHYHQFVKVSADSTLPDIRKLRKSYVTAKNMLEMGILTFRGVLHGQIPTTLREIFAFASLSYVISKTLHANGHLDESDILSGILDWRAAITDEREKFAFDAIAKRLWPEAMKIMHFIPMERKGMSPETATLRRDESEARCTQLPIRHESLDVETWRPIQEEFTSREDSLLSPPRVHEYASILQASTLAMPCLGGGGNELGELQDHVFQLFQETMSHEDYMFSDFLDFDGTQPEDFMDQLMYPTMPPDINPEVLDRSTSQTGCSADAQSILSASSSSPCLHFDEPSPVETLDPPASDSILHRLRDTPLFQVITRFVIQISEVGDLLNVLSGKGLSSGKDGIKSHHSRGPWAAFEFLGQAPTHFFGPLHRAAVQVDDIFSGIVAMAETFVRLGFLHTVREVENYIVTVSRYLAHSYTLFESILSKTLIHCLIASEGMTWNLLYTSCVQEADEYSIEYINRRKKAEKEWAHTGFVHLSPSEEMSSPTSSTNKNHQKHSPCPVKRRSSDNSPGSAGKRRRRDVSNPVSESEVPESEPTIIERCHYDDCLKFYTGKAAHNNLSRHIRTEHGRVVLKCPNCCKEVRRRDNLRQHFLTVHGSCELPDWIASKGRGLRNAQRVG